MPSGACALAFNQNYNPNNGSATVKDGSGNAVPCKIEGGTIKVTHSGTMFFVM